MSHVVNQKNKFFIIKTFLSRFGIDVQITRKEIYENRKKVIIKKANANTQNNINKGVQKTYNRISDKELVQKWILENPIVGEISQNEYRQKFYLKTHCCYRLTANLQ